MVQPIIIAAGGTGGHLFPAEALAAELLRRGERVALMTDARSAAYDSPVFANAERFVFKGPGFPGAGCARRCVVLLHYSWERCRRAGISGICCPARLWVLVAILPSRPWRQRG